jgi:mono/diheme cytochrome c family protein
MRRRIYALIILALAAGAFGLVITQPRLGDTADVTAATPDIARGQQVFTAAGCASCHMAPKATGDARLVLAGGQEFASPFGTFLAPNISPDPDHGIGGWTVLDLAHALRDGVSPKGQHYYPVLPYTAYAKMTGQDLTDLFAYLQSLPPSAEPSKPHQLGFPFTIRRSLGGWKWLFQSTDWHIDPVPPDQERGRYLVEALAHCAECHTPRNALGGLDRSRWMAGAPTADGKSTVPNITPAKLDWSEDDIVAYLTTGFTPEFDSVGGHMAHVVDNMAALPIDDVRAVARYLKALPARE